MKFDTGHNAVAKILDMKWRFPDNYDHTYSDLHTQEMYMKIKLLNVKPIRSK